MSEPTADEPWPVRVVSQKIGAWIGRLGWVWIDGQVAQITRRPGTSTVFITLRDPSADLSLTLTTSRDVVDTGAVATRLGEQDPLLRRRHAGHGTERRPARSGQDHEVKVLA